jgi:hypothetical protein
MLNKPDANELVCPFLQAIAFSCVLPVKVRGAEYRAETPGTGVDPSIE